MSISLGIYSDYSQASNSTTQTADSTSSGSLTSNDFIELFLAQLENQDPTNPMDTSELADQMYSLYQLEAQEQTNEYLASILEAQTSTLNTSSFQLIGETVLAEGNNLTLDDESSGVLTFNLSEQAEEVTINIYDEEGNLVRSITQSDLSSGENTYEWDGTNDEGVQLSTGSYTYEVVADDDSIEITTYSEYTIVSVSIISGSAVLQAEDGTEIDYSDVVKVIKA